MVENATLYLVGRAKGCFKHPIILKIASPTPSKKHYLCPTVSTAEVETVWVTGIIGKKSKYMEKKFWLLKT